VCRTVAPVIYLNPGNSSPVGIRNDMVRLVEAGLAVFLVSGLVWPCSVCQIRISNEEHALCLRSGVEQRSSVCDPEDLESKSQADSRHHVSLSYDQTNPQISLRCVAACRAELLRYHTSPASYIFYQIFTVNKFLIFLKFWRSEAREALDFLNTCAMHVNASAVAFASPLRSSVHGSAGICPAKGAIGLCANMLAFPAPFSDRGEGRGVFC